MKSFILTLLFSVNAFAGTAKFTWSHDYKSTDGQAMTPTSWRVYWGLDGQAINGIIQISPIGTPWKVDANGLRTFSLTMLKPEWLPGQRYCFQMTAFAADLESGRSGVVCKTMENNPTIPTLIKTE